jgi:hypothetical protein
MESRSVATIIAEWREAERELAVAPEEQWLGIMARIDQLQEEYHQAIADREGLAAELRHEPA